MIHKVGCALVLALAMIASTAKAPDPEVKIRADAVVLDRDRPQRRQFGAFTLLGAWRLKSESNRFGGISSLAIDGGRFVALSDSAQVLRFPIPGGPGSYPLQQSALPGIFNSPFLPDSDTESMALDPISGRIWIGFERSNSIRTFERGFARKLNYAAPQAMAGWPPNAGPEAMVRLMDGRFLVFSEEAEGSKGAYEALLFRGDPVRTGESPLRFYYRPPRGFDPTDAAQLPDGRLIILNRHFSIFDGVGAALTIIDPKEIAPEKILTARLLARLEAPLNIDNMEALAVQPAPDRGGDNVIVWIMSDDNHLVFQKTMLIKLLLDPRTIH